MPDLSSAEEGYLGLSVAEKSSLTLATLADVFGHTTLTLTDVEWLTGESPHG